MNWMEPVRWTVETVAATALVVVLAAGLYELYMLVIGDRLAERRAVARLEERQRTLEAWDRVMRSFRDRQLEEQQRLRADKF